ncbi:hypothetical protein ANN_19650 [Periplaneta americana]|uniref:Uncharacterized protein n=1 Tax=Periplaneta americana TaxID=6978 RepID=A0ABQ8SAS9_PERAM|nr:hypothetical protein ANN_19650 [Periplaneta americana]
MAGLCEGGNEPPGSLKARVTATAQCMGPVPTKNRDALEELRWVAKSGLKASYNGWGAHRANHTISPFWLDDRPPLLRHVAVRPAPLSVRGETPPPSRSASSAIAEAIQRRLTTFHGGRSRESAASGGRL